MTSELKRLERERPAMEAVIRCVEQIKNAKWEEICDRHGDSGCDLVLYFGRRACGLKLAELAAVVGLKEYAPVAMALKRFQAKLGRPGPWMNECKRLEQMLNVKT